MAQIAPSRLLRRLTTVSFTQLRRDVSLQMHRHMIEQESNAPARFQILVRHESTPQRPETRKGTIRVAMEQRLEEASRSGVPVLKITREEFF